MLTRKSGEVQNFVGIVPSHPDDATSAATEGASCVDVQKIYC